MNHDKMVLIGLYQQKFILKQKMTSKKNRDVNK